jgi:hypothetical protein
VPEPTDANPAAAKTPVKWDRPAAEVNALVRKAEKGDKAALAEVRGWLANPGIADALCGNPASEALRVLLGKYTSNPVIREATERKLDQLRSDLLGPSPTPLERLLVERVVATWLYLHHVEVAFTGRESYTLDQGSYYQKAITAAQRRHLAAVKGLSEVRKLALPALQVNIAKKQVNVAAAATNA